MHTRLEAKRTFVDIDGSSMSYIDVGAGDVIVLGHSYLWDADMWAPQISALSKHYRVIVPELWGHGRSGAMPAHTHNLRQIAQQHLLLLDGLGIQDFAVAGLSVGGMWATEIALQFPDRVTALALLGTYVGSEPSHSRAVYSAMLDTVASLAAVPDAVIDGLLPMFFSPATLANRPDLVESFRYQLRQTERRNLIDTVLPIGRMIFARKDALADLGRLAIPSLVMTGQQDRSRTPEEGRQMAGILGCKFFELAGAGHISSLEVPADVNHHLLSFFVEAFQATSGTSRPLPDKRIAGNRP